MSSAKNPPSASHDGHQQLTSVPLLVHAFALVVLANIVSGLLNFGGKIEEALGFYGVYHREPLNQLIHFFGVPLLLWSLLCCLQMLPLFSVKIGKRFVYQVTWGEIYVFAYVVGYIQMELVGGLLYSPIVFLMNTMAAHLARKDRDRAREQVRLMEQKKQDDSSSTLVVPWYGTGQLLKWAIAAHIFAWYVQIHPGHKIIEGAQPAILSSLGGALSSAPLFAFYEGLWYAGFCRDLQKKALERVAELTVQICQEGITQMRVCESLAL